MCKKTIGRLKYTSYSVVQVRTFINFLTSEFGSSTRGERDTILNHSIQTTLKRAAHLVVFKISVGRDLLNSMVRLQLLNTMVLTQLQLLTWPKYPTRLAYSRTQLDWPPVNYQLDSPTVEYPTDVFFKIPKFSAHSFRAWRHSHSSHISNPEFTMTILIVISSARERKLYPMSVHLN